MSEYPSVWGALLSDDGLKTTDSIKSLMLEQCRNLSQATGGKVRARFKNVRLNATFSAIAQIARAATEVTSQENPDDLTDANDLYRPKRFRFDIYSDKYRFRLFDIVMTPVYPVELSLDEGVFDEVKECLPRRGPNAQAGTILVVDDDELMSCFSTAASSNKVTYLIRSLTAESDLSYENDNDDA